MSDKPDEVADDDPEDRDMPWWERDPSEFAEPACIVCGGQGGWCGDIVNGQCVWEQCDCVEWPDGDDDA